VTPRSQASEPSPSWDSAVATTAPLMSTLRTPVQTCVLAVRWRTRLPPWGCSARGTSWERVLHEGSPLRPGAAHHAVGPSSPQGAPSRAERRHQGILMNGLRSKRLPVVIQGPRTWPSLPLPRDGGAGCAASCGRTSWERVPHESPPQARGGSSRDCEGWTSHRGGTLRPPGRPLERNAGTKTS
jgi:hypothetical protein